MSGLEEKRPRWGVRTSNPGKSRLPVLGGFDSHSLAAVLCSYTFSGVHQRSAVTAQRDENAHNIPTLCLYMFVAVLHDPTLGVWVDMLVWRTKWQERCNCFLRLR